MEVLLLIFAGVAFSVLLGLVAAAPAYFAGRFTRQQILDNKYYRHRTSQLVRFFVSTPVAACAGLLLGATVDVWYEFTILFSFLWGAVLGFTSLEDFADFGSRLPVAPTPKQ
jgi:ABC-type transporter Mla maintaining outer membrane lipid asymmetry permease subunit MlaE